jgi:hypothetical protein
MNCSTRTNIIHDSRQEIFNGVFEIILIYLIAPAIVFWSSGGARLLSHSSTSAASACKEIAKFFHLVISKLTHM